MNSGKRQCKAIAALLVLASVLCVCTEAGGGWIITTPGGNLLDEYASFIAGGYDAGRCS